MRLENILSGFTVPGKVSNSRRSNMTKDLTKDEKALFVIQNLVGEIVRLNKGPFKNYVSAWGGV